MSTDEQIDAVADAWHQHLIERGSIEVLGEANVYAKRLHMTEREAFIQGLMAGKKLAEGQGRA